MRVKRGPSREVTDMSENLSAGRRRVKEIMRSGSLADAEEYINGLDMTDEKKAALWLYAWSSQSRRRQRREAEAVIVMVGG
jgi:hypothetical protein